MQNNASGILVSEDQHNEDARQEFSRLLASVYRGEVEGRIVTSGAMTEQQRDDKMDQPSLAKGAMSGAKVGFFLGLIPLMASIIVAAGAGMLVTKATQVRIDRPHIRFDRQ